MPVPAVVPPRRLLSAARKRFGIAMIVVVLALVLTTATATASNASIRLAATPAVPAPVAAPTIPAPTVPATVKPRRATVTTRSSAGSGGATHRVTATAGKGLAVRATPDAAGALLGRKAEGAALSIRCQVRGTLVRDATQKRSSALWDRLAGGGYVANVYTTAYEPATTGYSRGLKACAGSTSTTASAASTASTVRATATTVAATSSATASGTPTTAQPGTVTVKTTVTNSG